MASIRERLDSMAESMGNKVRSTAKQMPGGAADTTVKSGEALDKGISAVGNAGSAVSDKAKSAFEDLKIRVKKSVPNLGPKIKEPIE